MKIKPSFGLDIGISDGGYVRLAQLDTVDYDEKVILLSMSEIKILRDELDSLIADDDWWSNSEDE